MKIAFYITNEAISSVDCSSLKKGNPGIGGSEYAMFALLDYLCLNKKGNQFDFILYANSLKNIPTSIKNVCIAVDLESAIEQAFNQGVNTLVFKHNSEYIMNGVLGNIKFSKDELKLVVWAHNFITRRFLNYYGKAKHISRIVNVSHDQLNSYRDHLAFKKSTAIYNGVNVDSFLINKEVYKKKNEVTYIGSLIPSKGFHKLAEYWKDVLKEFPDAVLNVIGSGSLYDRNQKLGLYGMAEESYEKSFMHYLIDEKGLIIDSVKFHGILGFEKNEILKRTKVGVPNPTGNTETFGYTAVEMQLLDVLVTTKNCIGYRETVFEKNNLYRDETKLPEYICKLLKSENLENKDSLKYIDNNFSLKNVSNNWLKLFNEVLEGKSPEISKLENPSFSSKLIELNRKLKNSIPFGYTILPSHLFFKSIVYKFKK